MIDVMDLNIQYLSTSIVAVEYLADQPRLVPIIEACVWETVGFGGMKSAHSSLELPSGLFRRVLFSSPRGPQNSIAFVSWIPMCEM